MRYRDWRSALIAPQTTIRDALRNIDTVSLQIAMVVDAEGRLLGTVTDGDVRRGLLNGISLDDVVEKVMFKTPRSVQQGASDDDILRLMRDTPVRQVPILDGCNRVVGLKIFSDLMKMPHLSNTVVLMAGGLGTRLLPLTQEVPKPLIHVGDRPILEVIISNFRRQGFYRFVISVNYKAHMIQDYFGNGQRLGVEITYLHEKQRLGTAGALSLLAQRPTESFFVMNADVLSNINFRQLLDFHLEHKTAATMCVREYTLQVPFGVITQEDHRLTGIEEKPEYRLFVNAGIYVLEPEILELIPKNEFYDMTTLFRTMLEQDLDPGTFPLREYWMDIGQIADLEKANGEFSRHFCSPESWHSE